MPLITAMPVDCVIVILPCCGANYVVVGYWYLPGVMPTVLGCSQLDVVRFVIPVIVIVMVIPHILTLPSRLCYRPFFRPCSTLLLPGFTGLTLPVGFPPLRL